MTYVIVPMILSDKIEAKITEALNGRECSEDERAKINSQLLDCYYATGEIPDFTLKTNSSLKQGETPHQHSKKSDHIK